MEEGALIKQANDILYLKSKILNIVQQKKSQEDYNKIVNMFEDLKNKYDDYMSFENYFFNQSLRERMSNISKEPLKTIKRNPDSPIIAGIVGKAIGGTELGVYSAVNTAIKNNIAETQKAVNELKNELNKEQIKKEQEEKEKRHRDVMEYQAKKLNNAKGKVIDFLPLLKNEICSIEEVNEIIKKVDIYKAEDQKRLDMLKEQKQKEEERQAIIRTSNILTKFFGGSGIILLICGILIISLGEPLGIGAFIFAGLLFLMAFYENKKEKKHSISNFKKEV